MKHLNKILVYLKLKDEIKLIGNGNKKEELKTLFYFTGKRSYLLRGKNARQNRVMNKKMKNKINLFVKKLKQKQNFKKD